MTGDIDGNGNKVLFGNVYSQVSDLPSASTYHGMFAHVHATGKGYFAHAGNWVVLANDTEKLNLSGGTMTGNLDVGGSVEFDSLSGTGSVAITDILDEDNMASNSATALATQQSIKAYTDASVAGLIDSSPSALNTLNELAAALGDDASFSTTVTNSIATKLPLSGGTMTGNISHAGDLTLDVAGDIILDADGGDIRLHDGGVLFGKFTQYQTDFYIDTSVSDRDMFFRGIDGGIQFVALTLDMSEAGAATFNSTVTANNGINVDNINIDGTTIALSSGNLTLDVAGDIILDADGGDVLFHDGGLHYASIRRNGEDAVFKSIIQDKDIIFKGNDGGVEREVLRLDMSDAGTAIFNNNVLVGKTSESGNTAGHFISESGYQRSTRNGSVQVLNRITTDGPITDFQKDGSSVGSIGTVGGIIYVGKSDTTIAFDETADAVKPRGTAGAQRDGAINLGTAGNRWNNLYLSGSIANPSGDLTLDAAGDINLDADGAQIRFKDAGTEFLRVSNESGFVEIQSPVSNSDIKFNGVDGSSAITALTLDMSNAGAATFNHSVLLSGTGGLTTTGGNNLTVSGSVADHAGLIFATHAILPAEAGAEASANVIDIGANANEFKSLYLNTSIVNDSGFTIDSGGDITLDAGADGVVLKLNGANRGQFSDGGSASFEIKSMENNADMHFRGVDNNSEITALTLDMSAAGAATFNNAVTATTFNGDGSNLTGVGGSTDAGAVGTYVFARIYITGYRSFGNLMSASEISNTTPAGLKPAGTSDASGSISGSWRLMGYIDNNPTTTLFVRVS